MSILQIKAKLTSKFAELGNKNGTASPNSTDNRAKIAHEFFVADTLRSVANKRYEDAKKAAAEAGLLADDPVPSSTVVTYENEHVTISAKTASAARRLDGKKLSAALIRELGAAKATKIVEDSQVESKPATSYIFAAK
jgi:hypothetical protein